MENVIKKRANQLQRAKTTNAKQDPPREVKTLVSEAIAWYEFGQIAGDMSWTRTAGTKVGIQFNAAEFDNKPESSMAKELMKERLYSRDVWVVRGEHWLQIEKSSDWR